MEVLILNIEKYNISKIKISDQFFLFIYIFSDSLHYIFRLQILYFQVSNLFFPLSDSFFHILLR